MGYKVLSCGSNGNYQLGISDDEDYNTLQAAEFHIDDKVVSDMPDKPIKIVCGGNHTFVLFESGSLYSCGQNTYGQCALASRQHIVGFHQVQGSWKDVSAGWEFSVLVNKHDELFVCGLGLKHELGLGSITRTEMKKLDIKFPSPINKIRSCVNHTILVLQNGELHGWGNCRKGQLGTLVAKANGKLPSTLTSPTKLNFGVEQILDFDIGRDVTYIYSGTHIYIFGKTKESFTVEKPIGSLKSMWSSVHYTCDSKINSYGNNSHGQLIPSTSPCPRSFEIGSEHGLLHANNKVYAWGWGEHGNCGVHSKPVSSKLEDQVTFNYLNEIYSGSNVILLGCGCATSWIIVSTV